MLDTTRQRFREIYSSKQDIIEWMINFGNEDDKTIGRIIKQTAMGK